MFSNRNQATIARIQFALAGANAHINHDLPEAIVATCQLTGATPDHAGTHYNDYTALNATLDGLIVRTGDAPGSLLTHTTITQNLMLRNGLSNRRFGILLLANLSGAGSDTQIAHTTITDNEVRENGNTGILTFVLGDNNLITDLTIARNTASANVAQGIKASSKNNLNKQDAAGKLAV